MATNITDLANSVGASASGPMKIRVEGMGSSEEHPAGEQLKVLIALSSAAAGRRAGILRTPIRVSSPTGLRFRPPEDRCW